MHLPEDLHLAFGESTLKKLHSLQKKTNNYMTKTNCRLYPAKAMLIKNKNLKTNKGVILQSLMRYKEYLRSLNNYTNAEIEKIM